MQCTLCPRACRAERNESTGNGFCQLPTTMRIARIAPHLWEEPPISGKNGTGAVFFSVLRILRMVWQTGSRIIWTSWMQGKNMKN